MKRVQRKACELLSTDYKRTRALPLGGKSADEDIECRFAPWIFDCANEAKEYRSLFVIGENLRWEMITLSTGCRRSDSGMITLRLVVVEQDCLSSESAENGL